MVLGPKTHLILHHYVPVVELIDWPLRKVRGVLLPLSGEERFTSRQITAYRTHKFIMDYPVGFTVGVADVFTLGDRRFDIKAIVDPAEQHRHLEIDLNELVGGY